MARVVAAALAVLLAAGLGGCSKRDPHPRPPTIDGVEVFAELAHDHAPPPSYPHTPPVGGPHSRAWLNCGVYGEPVPNGNAVHSMEHGAVWITYRPALSRADVDAVERLAGIEPGYVLISPYDGLPSPVVATAWGYQLRVDQPDDPRLAEFVRQYAGGDQGGEPGAPCSGGLTPEQAELYNASPRQTP